MLGGTKIPLLGLILVAFGGTGVYASRITFKAYPNILKANLTTAASMRCALEDTEVTRSVTNIVTNTDEDIAHVTAILITNNDGSVAHASAFDAPITLTDHGNLEVNADVSGNSTEGYLQLTWKIPSLISTGEYACQITTIDSHHHFTVFRSTLEMSMETPSINDVVVMLKQQRQTIQDNAAEITSLQQQDAVKTKLLNNQSLEITSLQQQDAAMIELSNNQSLEIISLNQILNNQSLDIMKLNNCTTPRVAFMAVLTGSGQITVKSGPVVFNKVVTKTDNSYNPTTGQFTCVIPGLYVFNTNAVVYSKHIVYLQLHINSVKITTAVAHAQGPHAIDSASAPAVVLLKKDDVVKVVAAAAAYNGVYMDGNMWQANTFAGRLLHADTCLH